MSNRKRWGLIALILLLGVGLLVLWQQRGTLQARLETEVAGHEVTRLALDSALNEGQRWKAAAEATLPKIAGLQGLVRDCLERETAAQADAEARATIMAYPRPTPATNEAPAERARPVTTTVTKTAIVKEQRHELTVDAATRRAALARLNRPL